MILRIFLLLLALNMVAFVVRAEANERLQFDDETARVDIYELQDAMSGDFQRRDEDSLTELGSRLLSWSLSERHSGHRYASQGAVPDHGLALVDEGACLNLRWKF